MTLAELNIKATALQIEDAIRETYAAEIAETGRKVRHIDIDETVAETGESFTVENGRVIWFDENGEAYGIDENLGRTAAMIADEVYTGYAESLGDEVMGWADFYRMTVAI